MRPIQVKESGLGPRKSSLGCIGIGLNQGYTLPVLFESHLAKYILRDNEASFSLTMM